MSNTLPDKKENRTKVTVKRGAHFFNVDFIFLTKMKEPIVAILFSQLFVLCSKSTKAWRIAGLGFSWSKWESTFLNVRCWADAAAAKCLQKKNSKFRSLILGVGNQALDGLLHSCSEIRFFCKILLQISCFISFLLLRTLKMTI